MKKALIKTAVLILAFIASIIICGMNTNQEGANLTNEMAQAEFPIIEIFYKNNEMAELHGYARPMEYTSMRDNLVAVHSDRDLKVKIQTYSRKIESLKYQIRNIDGTHLVSEGDLDCGDSTADELTISFHVDNMLENDEEYQLSFCLGENGRDIYYYTRLMKTENEKLDTYLSFVADFHKKSLDKKKAEDLATYIEPNAGIMSNNDYSYSTINSSLAQISYGKWNPTEVGEAHYKICEFNSRYGVFAVNYVLGSVGDSGEQEYYNATEYYRVGYSEEGLRCYLYDFEREINQIFRSDGDNYRERDVVLGIRDNNVKYAKSENGRIICFVQEGELWSINESNDYLTRIFSFRGYEGIDARENFDAHDIQIISVEEGGSVNFAVYGYMNRGEHEGEVGILVCHFDSVQSTVEELLFIESDESYQRMIADMDGIIFAGNSGIVYVMDKGSFYSIKPETNEITRLANALPKDQYIYSDRYHILAWQNEKGGDIEVINMATQRMKTIESEDKFLTLIDYIDDDLVYGITDKDTKKMINGRLPYDKLCIYSPVAGSAIKEYEKSGLYITDVEVDEYTLLLERASYNSEEGYTATEPDSIVNKSGENILDKNIGKVKDEKKNNLVTLSLYSSNTDREYNLVTSQEIIQTDPHTVILDPEDNERYYVYAKAELLAYYSTLSDAIEVADANRGIVVDSNLNEVWGRAHDAVHNAIKLTMDETVGELTPEVVIENMFPDATRYEVSNVTLVQMLYYISNGIPVIAHTSDGDVLITGYDSNIVRVVNVSTGESKNQYQDTFNSDMLSTGARYSVYVGK